jgi:hypothetical protein
MSIEQEANAPEPVRQTRRNKIDMVDSCELVIRMARDLMDYAKRIPVEDDARHAQLVQELADAVKSARAAVNYCIIKRG